MRGSGDRPIAYVDESVSANGHLYTMTAVVVAADAIREIRRGVQEQAGKRGYFHASEAQESDRARLTGYLAGQPGVSTIVTVKAPVEPGRREAARQQCLAELASRVARAGVRSMVLDDRWAGQEASSGRHRQIAASALERQHDKDTVEACRRSGVVPKEFVARHVDDRQQPMLWAADTLAWQVRHSLEYDEPSRVAQLSTKLQIVEARLVLLRERGRDAGRVRPPARVPSTGLQARLDLLMAVARHTSARQSVRRELRKPTGAGRDEALRDAKENLARAEKGLREAKERARGTPSLEKYTRRDGAD